MEIVIRVAIIYLFLIFGFRVIGKREFSQMTPLELVTLLIIPEIVSQSLTREDFSLTTALVGTATLLSIVFISSALQHRSETLSNAISGTPTVLVHDGQYIGENINKERVPPDEIFDAMHKVGLERLEQVKWAILEEDGKVSIVPMEKQTESNPRPPEAEQIG